MGECVGHVLTGMWPMCGRRNSKLGLDLVKCCCWNWKSEFFKETRGKDTEDSSELKCAKRNGGCISSRFPSADDVSAHSLGQSAFGLICEMIGR